MTDFRMAGFLAVTFVHPGIGQMIGAIDLPVSRESTTRYPYIAGSSFKGALRDAAERQWGKADPRLISVFGTTADGAGDLAVSDLRLLLLPVRSLDTAFRYVTCPQILQRLATDLTRVGLNKPSFGGTAFSELKPGKSAVASDGEKIFLEELAFERDATMRAEVAQAASTAMTLMPADFASACDVASRLVVLHDDDFAWLAEHGLPVRMRNKLLDDTKTVEGGALWTEEYLAPETLLYGLLGARRNDPLQDIQTLIKVDEKGFVQVGGNETVGQGWLQATLLEWPTP